MHTVGKRAVFGVVGPVFAAEVARQTVGLECLEG